MKIKVLLLSSLFLMGIIFASPQGASAQTWAFCKVDGVGATTFASGAYGVFTHESSTPIFSKKSLYFIDSASKEMLATVLTAISLDKNVWLRVMADGQTIDRIRIDMN